MDWILVLNKFGTRILRICTDYKKIFYAFSKANTLTYIRIICVHQCQSVSQLYL
jgi:hypothetical protein